MIKLVVGNKDITQAIKPPIKIEDDFSYGSVKLSFDFKYLKDSFTVRPGLPVKLYVNKKLWFDGFVIDWGNSFSKDGQMVAHDPFYYLVRSSWDFEWRKKTATQISKELFSRYGIKTNDIIGSSYVFDKILCRGQDYDSVFSVLITVWSETKKRTGKKYWLRYEEGARIFERKPNKKLPIWSALESSTYTESIDEMVNEFRIVDREKNIVVTKKDAGSIKLYGRISKAEDYTAKNKSDATRYADQQLKSSSELISKHDVNAVFPLETQRFWSGDYVYTPDADSKKLHGNYIRKINIDLFNSHMKLAAELQRTVDLPILDFVKIEEDKPKKKVNKK